MLSLYFTNYKLISSVAIITICSIGLMYQIESVSERYFEFRTKTLINMVLQSKVGYPSVSICFRFNDMLDREKIKKYKNIKLKHWSEPGYDNDKFFSNTMNLTVSEIFNFTPMEDNVLAKGVGCNIRYPEQYMTEYVNTSHCYRSFRIRKYLVREYVCFLFQPRITNKDLYIHEFNLSPALVGIMYRLFLNKNIFKNMYVMSLAVHSNRSAILYDTLFSSNILMKMNTLPTTFVFHREFERLRMKKPYDTACIPVPIGRSTWYEYMLKKVDRQSVSKWNFSIPFRLSFNSSLNSRKVLDYRIFRDIPAYREWLVDAMKRSFNDAPINCFTNYFTTRSQMFHDGRTAFAVTWTQDEKIFLVHASEQELIDFIVYLCSCIGIWFGFSSYSVLNSSKKLIFKELSESKEILKLKKEVENQMFESESLRYDMLRMNRRIMNNIRSQRSRNRILIKD